jgi:hypothetical protein
MTIVPFTKALVFLRFSHNSQDDPRLTFKLECLKKRETLIHGISMAEF